MTTEMAFDPTAVDSIDQSSVDAGGPQFPTIQWNYGDAKMKKAGGMDYQGGWFIPDDMVDGAALEAAGWQAASWLHQGGAEVTGYWRREIAVSVIAARKRWEVFGEYGSGGAQAFDWRSYEAAKAAGRPTSRLHVLCLVKGLEELGPFVLTLKGMGAMAFEGTLSANGALTQFAATVLRAANMASDAAARATGRPGGKRWPYRAFWLPVGADREGSGEPRFTEVGRGRDTSHVVLPVALGIPDKADAVNLAKFYIGNDLLGQVNELWAEAEENWAHAWDSLEPGAQTGPSNDNGNDNDAGGAVQSQPAPAMTDDVLASLGL